MDYKHQHLLQIINTLNIHEVLIIVVMEAKRILWNICDKKITFAIPAEPLYMPYETISIKRNNKV